MSDQPRALRLAECLLRDRDMNWPDFENMQSAAAELRRLHSVNAELLSSLEWMVAKFGAGYSPGESVGVDAARSRITRARALGP